MLRGVSDKTLLEIVELIYAAGCDPSGWDAVVERCQLVHPGCGFSLIVALNGSPIGPVALGVGYDPAHLAAYVEHYHKINPYEPILAGVPVGRIVKASELVTPDWLHQQAFYHEWLRPAGDFTHGATVTLARSSEVYSRVTVEIPQKLGKLEQSATEFLSRLKPHMLRALDVTVRMQGDVLARAALDTTLARISWPAVIVDGRQKIHALNERARRMIERGEVIKEAFGSKLIFATDENTDSLAASMRILDEFPPARPTNFIAGLPGGKRCPIYVMPLGKTMWPANRALRYAMVLIGTEQRQFQSPVSVLRGLYGLSAAETNVVLRLASGMNAQQVAEAGGVTTTTARNQIASAMAKLDVHRRARLWRS